MVEGLRQRRRMAAGDDDTGVKQPLLSHEDSAEEGHSADVSTPLLPSQQQIILHPGPFDLQRFLCSIFICWQHVLDAVFTCLSQVLPLSGASVNLTPLQEHQMQRLLDRSAQRFNVEDEDDRDALRRLWGFAFTDLPCTTLKSPQWKEMGWQGEDPSTDIRGSGRLGLDCLLYLAEAHPDVFSRLMNKVEGQRSDWEYPFAVAGLNISFKLMEVIGLQAAGPRLAASAGGGVARVLQSSAGRGFVSLLAHEGDDSEKVFEEVFVATFEYLDREWLRQRASYMQFNQVLAATTTKLDGVLSTRPRGIADLRAKLLGGY